MKEFTRIAILMLYGLFGTYMAAYVEDTRIVDKFYEYEYIPIGKFRFLCLRSRNEKRLIRKITRDREILSILCFFILLIIVFIFCIIFAILNIDSNMVYTILFIIISFVMGLQLYFFVKVRDKCSSLVDFRIKVLEVTEKNLSRCARNIMRQHYEGENRSYTIQKQEKNTFWYDYIEYHLYVDGQYFQTLVKQQKYRYSSIVETKWYE